MMTKTTEPATSATEKPKLHKTEAEWKQALTPEQFHVLRERGTERAFSGAYADFHGEAIFQCAGCGQDLFRSEHKYDSGSGWPSFWAPLDAQAVNTTKDSSHGMSRVEVHCSRCAGHLGHLFNDGPEPTGMRYCINSVSLRAVSNQDNTERADKP